MDGEELLNGLLENSFFIKIIKAGAVLILSFAPLAAICLAVAGKDFLTIRLK